MTGKKYTLRLMTMSAKLDIDVQIERVSKNKIRLRDNTNNVCFLLIQRHKPEHKFLFRYFNEKLNGQGS